MHRKQVFRSMKDDRQSKLHLILSLISFKSFQILDDRKLKNEFKVKDDFICNKQIFKLNWLPVAKFLLYRYVSSCRTPNLCYLFTVNEAPLL